MVSLYFSASVEILEPYHPYYVKVGDSMQIQCVSSNEDLEWTRSTPEVNFLFLSKRSPQKMFACATIAISGLPRHRESKENREFECSFFSDRENTGNLQKYILKMFLHRELTSNTGKIFKSLRIYQDCGGILLQSFGFEANFE